MAYFDYNSEYLIKNGKPWYPVMGEIHFSRYPKEYWKESIYKMKAGGVQIVSTYIFWLHHEEIESEFDFAGQKELSGFLEACAECGIYVFLRLGPWCHGEARNGGFPDWLLKKDFKRRSDAPEYLEYVRKFWREIYNQAEGWLWKDGGPVIGVQIENEYGHCGGKGEDEHIRTLTALAQELGFDVPYYTATGWGGALIGDLLPVMGGYCEAPWNQTLNELGPNVNYVITTERNDSNIGSDHRLGAGLTFDTSKYPFLTAELGGGLQVTYNRRPRARAADIGAVSLVKMASGANLLGYYMYHGGTHPKGKLSGLQESRESGGYCDLPELNYDFRAPIREYGQISETYKEIKLLSMFLRDFGESFCCMKVIIPEDNPVKPTDLKSLRYSYRINDGSGYLFINNYVRKHQMAEHKNKTINIKTNESAITFTDLDIKDQDFYFYPFNMPIGEAMIKTAQATPLCILNGSNYVFYTDKDPKYVIDGDLNAQKIITISREGAKNAYKVSIKGTEYLLISRAPVIQTSEGVSLITRGDCVVKSYPALPSTEGFEITGYDGEFTVYEKKVLINYPKIEYSLSNNNYLMKEYQLELSDVSGGDCFLKINYEGNIAELFNDKGEKIADSFYCGDIWEVGLKRFEFPKKLTLRIFSLEKNAPIFLDIYPEMQNGRACRLIGIEPEIEKNIKIGG